MGHAERKSYSYQEPGEPPAGAFRMLPPVTRSHPRSHLLLPTSSPFISHKKEVISTRMGCNMTVFHLESKPSCIFFCISHLQSCVLGIYFCTLLVNTVCVYVCVITKKVIFEKTSPLDFTGSPNSVFPRGNN